MMLRKLRNLLSLHPPLPNVESVLEDVRTGDLSVEEAAAKIRVDAMRPYLPPWSLQLLRFAGGIFVVVGLSLATYSMSIGIGKSTIRGTVVEMIGDQMKSPVVEYRVDGVAHRIRGFISSSPPAHAKGDMVDVIYDASDPSVAKTDTFRERWLFPVVLVGAGLNAIFLSFALPWIFRIIVGANQGVRRRAAEAVNKFGDR